MVASDDTCENSKMLNRQVIFQGQAIKLGDIIPRDYQIKGELLTSILKGGDLKIGVPLQNLGESLDYHIDRTLVRSNNVRDEVMSINDDIIAIQGLTKKKLESKYNVRDVFDFNSDEFDLKCKKIFILRDDSAMEDYRRVCDYSNGKSNIHWLVSLGANNLKWIASCGSVQLLKLHIIKEQINDCATNKLFTNSKIVIVAAEPGTGKTTFLSSLAHRETDCGRPTWRGRVNLLDTCAKLKDLKEDLVFDYVCDLLSLSTEWEKELFQHYYQNEGRIELMFDGYDDIANNYRDNVFMMLKQLRDNSKVNRIWVTSRPNVSDELENEMGTLAVRLKPFCRNQQVTFLYRIWTKTLETTNINENAAVGIINKFLDSTSELIEIPLQLKMIADVYGEFFKTQYDRVVNHNMECDVTSIFVKSNFNKYVLYSAFISKKYRQIFMKNNKMDDDNLCNAVLKFQNEHETFALLAMFNEESLRELMGNDSYDEDVDVEKFGIVVGMVNGVPKFVHWTFVEYFIATRLIRMLGESDNMKKVRTFFEIEKIKENALVRSFFDYAAIEDDNPETRSHEYLFLNATIANDYDTVSAMLNDAQIKMKVLNCCDRAGRTALYLASYYKHTNIVGLLIRNNADVSIEDKVFEWTALKFAKQNKSLEAAELLVENGVSLDYITEAIENTKRLKNRIGRLDFAYEVVERGLLNLVKAALKANPELINMSVEQYHTLLNLASVKGHSDVVSCLISFGANTMAKDNDGNTALHVAIIHRQLEVFKKIIRLVPETINAIDKHKLTPLCVAAALKHNEFVEYLIKEYPSVMNDSAGRLPLHFASSEGHVDTVSYLLSSGADTTVKDNDGYTALHLAVQNNQVDVVKAFIELKPKIISKKDQMKRTPLCLAAKLNRTEIVELLAKANPSKVDKYDCSRKTPLHLASEEGHVDVVSCLIASGANSTLNDEDGYTPLHSAVKYKQFEVVKKFSQLKPKDFELKDKNGSAPLFMAINLNHREIVDFIVDEHPSGINDIDSLKKTPLHLASEKGYAETVTRLLFSKANPAIMDKRGKTPLQVAIQHNRLEVVKVFIKLRPDSLRVKGEKGWTPLFSAAELGHFEMVQLMIKAYRDGPTDIDLSGRTPMHWAAEKGHLDLVRYLLGSRANPVVQDNDGNTPLHLAVQQKHHKVVRLIKRNVPNNIEIKNNEGKTPVQISRAKGYERIYNVLIYEIDQES